MRCLLKRATFLRSSKVGRFVLGRSDNSAGPNVDGTKGRSYGRRATKIMDLAKTGSRPILKAWTTSKPDSRIRAESVLIDQNLTYVAFLVMWSSESMPQNA
jgi:hypothetical protein